MKKLILCLFLIIPSACYDKKELLDLVFPISIGIEYKDDQYLVTIQFMNLSSQSLVGNESSFSEEQYEIATGDGFSIENCIYEIANALRSQISLTHVNSIIIGQGTLDKNILDNITNYLMYNAEIRPTTNIFYTNTDVKEIYTVTAHLNKTPYYSLVNAADFSSLNPLAASPNILNFVRYYHERDIISSMPVLSVSDEIISTVGKEKKEKNYFDVESVLFVTGDEFYKELDIKELDGIAWTSSRTVDYFHSFVINDDTIDIKVEKLHSKIEFNRENNQFIVSSKIHLTVLRSSKETNLEDLEQIITKHLDEDVIKTYRYALSQGVDVYGLNGMSTRFYQTNVDLNQYSLVSDISINLELGSLYLYPQE